ncbi:RBBP9/YdeN family alpha/beta hydrolase [Rhizobium leucaenae]|uniref:Serine hydrolase family protein n=1 Tax=Rhizobium leucaenae TaxID=29450 RepID=A0A7W7EMM6_9HYPH|nr:alpha/beta fold hydrolase [Rhizobium leucaenae]MBB4571246.1 hypothetical protein [Rhizobium leucaenae]MBB6304869.1 hypothetical protein [Rhizobium leucaenae]
MSDIIVLPGLGGSGEGHWQTLWERQTPEMRRFLPASWDRPELADWLAALDREISDSKTPPVLVVHSLACQLVAHWAASAPARILGAFLVSAPDPTGDVYLTDAPSFANPPRQRLPFPSLLIASTNDPFGSFAYATESAAVWGSELINAGALGHINAHSEIGDWPKGRALFDRFRTELA